MKRIQKLIICLIVVISTIGINFIIPVEYKHYFQGIVAYFFALIIVLALLKAASKTPPHKVSDRYDYEYTNEEKNDVIF